MTLRTINPPPRIMQRSPTLREQHPKFLFQNNPGTLNNPSSLHLQLIHIKPLNLPRMNNNCWLQAQIQLHPNYPNQNSKLSPIPRLTQFFPINTTTLPTQNHKLQSMILKHHWQTQLTVTSSEKL